MSAIPAHILRYAALANQHAAAGNDAAAVEATAVAAVLDIQQHQAGFLAQADGNIQLCGLYTRAFTRALADLPWAPPPARHGAPSILLAAQCIAPGQAASHIILRLVRELAASGWRTGLLLAEELTQRTPPLTLLRTQDAPSAKLAPDLLTEIARHAEILTAPTTGTFLDAVRAMTPAARAWGPDIAAFVASPACPVQAGLAVARIAPVQVNLSVGVPLLIQGSDHILYNNPRTLAAHAPTLAARGFAASTVATSGGDAAPGATATPIDRGQFGIPKDAPLLVSAANCLPRRMLGGTFAGDLAAFLAAHPTAHWLGVGLGDFSAVLRALKAPGRVHAAGSVPDIRPYVRAADIFLNEYPEGGGNTVIEAMGCGTPVAAMHAGPAHGCCIGAELVGGDAIPSMDVRAYWSLVSRWAHDPAARAAAGTRQQRRALDTLDFAPITAAYRRTLESLLPAPAAAAVAAA